MTRRSLMGLARSGTVINGTIVASPAEPEKPSIDTVMGGLAPASVGAVIRPEVHLTGEQAELQNRHYLTLVRQGLTLRSRIRDL